MKEQILTYFFDSAEIKLIIAIFLFTGLTIAMGIDLVLGVRKAKQNGIYRTSTGLRETTQKALINYSVFILTLIIDLINPVGLHVTLFQYPVFTTLWAMYIIGTEAYSIYEKADKKMRNQKERQARELLEVLAKIKENYDKVKDA